MSDFNWLHKTLSFVVDYTQLRFCEFANVGRKFIG